MLWCSLRVRGTRCVLLGGHRRRSSTSLFRPDLLRYPFLISYDRVAAAWQRTMDLASALQRHTNSSTKNARASRQFFESGVVIYHNNAWHKLGDDSAFFPSLNNRPLRTPPPHAPTQLITPLQAGNS